MNQVNLLYLNDPIFVTGLQGLQYTRRATVAHHHLVAHQLLHCRYFEDIIYQAAVRTKLGRKGGGDSLVPAQPKQLFGGERAAQAVAEHVRGGVRGCTGQ